MLRRLVQAIGHLAGAPFGYDLCIESYHDQSGKFQQRFKWAKLEIVRHTHYSVRWTRTDGQKFSRMHTSFERALRLANQLITEGFPQVEIWQEENVDRLLSRRNVVR